VFIRSDLHDTTSVNGVWQKDPDGYHCTLAFKDGSQVERDFHVASHGYTAGKEDFTLRKATHTQEKKDTTKRRGDKVVWPPEHRLEEWQDSPIAYSHVP
jgi:hypothetical protein